MNHLFSLVIYLLSASSPKRFQFRSPAPFYKTTTTKRYWPSIELDRWPCNRLSFVCDACIFFGTRTHYTSPFSLSFFGLNTTLKFVCRLLSSSFEPDSFYGRCSCSNLKDVLPPPPWQLGSTKLKIRTVCYKISNFMGLATFWRQRRRGKGKKGCYAVRPCSLLASCWMKGFENLVKIPSSFISLMTRFKWILFLVWCKVKDFLWRGTIAQYNKI